MLRARRPATRPDNMRQQLRELSGTQGIPDNRYLMPEMHGPVELELLQDMGVPVPDDPPLVYERAAVRDGVRRRHKAVIEAMTRRSDRTASTTGEGDPSHLRHRPLIRGGGTWWRRNLLPRGDGQPGAVEYAACRQLRWSGRTTRSGRSSQQGLGDDQGERRCARCLWLLPGGEPTE